MNLLVRILLLLGLLLWQASGWAAPADEATLRLRSATFMGPTGEYAVTLPHVPDLREFDAQGSRVRYRVNVDLPEVPREPLGVYINKMSLSGALYLNGELVGQCADGALERLRCLHLPILFKPALQLWRAGHNTLEIEIFGSHRQTNGLSEIWIGDSNQLYKHRYAPRMWWTVQFTESLGHAVVALGLLALIVGLSLREEAIYRWYGWTCLFLVASFSNLIADEVPIPASFLNWLIVVGRLLAAHFFVMTCLHLLGKARRWQAQWTIAYAVFSALALFLLKENRWAVAAAYLPILVTTPVLIGFSIRWSLQSRQKQHILTCGILAFLFVLGARDWFLFGGQASFEYVYLIPYGFSVTVLFIGYMLITRLVESLRRARELSTELESQVAARTAELASALQNLQHLEQTALKLTDAIPVGTYVLEASPQGAPHFTFLSNRWLKMLALERQAVMADPTQALERIHPEDRDGLIAQHQKVFAQPQPLTWEGRMVVHGETRWLSIEAIPRLLPDHSTAYEGVIVDITAYKQTQEALKEAYERLTEAAVQHSKNEERERLLQDMHDGFGSQLASARLLAETGQITPSDLPVILQECMADLYLVADTLSHSHNTLADSLADMRFRTEKRTAHLPLELHWHIDLPETHALPQRSILQVLRITQEAINNALKHAQARNIRISARLENSPPQLRIQVSDDGIGQPEGVVHGRGMHNMQQRARTLGATLAITSNAPGTCVSLVLPVA